MDLEMVIPIVMFIVIFGIVFVSVYYYHRSRREMQQTLRSAIDQGQVLTPEVVQSLTGSAPASGYRDLRRGMILVAIAISMIGLGLMLDDEDARATLAGLALFPLLIGIAYIAMHKLGLREV